MKKVKIYVTLKESILDPQGSAVQGSLKKIESLEPTKEIRISVPASPIKTKQDNEAIIPKQTTEEDVKKEKRSLEETFRHYYLTFI